MKSLTLILSICLLSMSYTYGMIIPKLTELCGQFLGEQIIDDSKLDCDKIMNALLTYKDARFEDPIYLKIVFGVLASKKLSKAEKFSLILNLVDFLKTAPSQQPKKYIKQLIQKIITLMYQIPHLGNETATSLQALLKLDEKRTWLLPYFALRDSFIIDALCEYILKNDIKDIDKLPIKRKKMTLFLCLNPEIMARLKENKRYVPSQETLLKACKEKKTEAFKVMIHIGANINGKINDNDWTLLLCAAWENDKEGVKLLLESGANVNVSSKKGCTALMAAAQKGYIEIVRLLLAYGANVNLEDSEGMTAVRIALINGHAHVVQELLNSGAQLNTQDKQRLLSSDLAEYESIRQSILKQNVNLQDQKGWTQLIHAVWNQDSNKVKELLKQKADVTVKATNGATALTAAAQKGKADIVTLLLQSGADVNVRNNTGITPLMIAAEKGYVEVVKLLLASGADKDLFDNQGRNALALALENKRGAVVDLLLN